MTATTFLFHDGCPICLDVAETFTSIIKLVEIVNLSKYPERTADAQALGVSVLPSIVIDGKVFPLNPHSSVAEH
jgi:glutaredoxin